MNTKSVLHNVNFEQDLYLVARSRNMNVSMTHYSILFNTQNKQKTRQTKEHWTILMVRVKV